MRARPSSGAQSRSRLKVKSLGVPLPWNIRVRMSQEELSSGDDPCLCSSATLALSTDPCYNQHRRSRAVSNPPLHRAPQALRLGRRPRHQRARRRSDTSRRRRPCAPRLHCQHAWRRLRTSLHMRPAESTGSPSGGRRGRAHRKALLARASEAPVGAPTRSLGGVAGRKQVWRQELRHSYHSLSLCHGMSDELCAFLDVCVPSFRRFPSSLLCIFTGQAWL